MRGSPLWTPWTTSAGVNVGRRSRVKVQSRLTLSPFGAVESGRMEIVLVSGRCIVVDVSVDSAAFDRVINILDRR